MKKGDLFTTVGLSGRYLLMEVVRDGPGWVDWKILDSSVRHDVGIMGRLPLPAPLCQVLTEAEEAGWRMGFKPDWWG